MSRKHDCWDYHGLTDDGAELAEGAIEDVVALVRRIGNERLARVLIDEAIFRVFELPTRSEKFQNIYLGGKRVERT